MAGILGLLKHVVESKHRENVLPNYLRSCAEQLAFSKGQAGISSLIGIINSKLNESSSRYEGLIFLQSFLPQCNVDILSENAITWMTLCLKGTSLVTTSSLAYSVLKLLFQATAEVPELTKHVAASVVPKLAEQIHLGIQPHSLLSALECLETCMDKYNGPCGPHKRIIEEFLFSLVDFKGSQQTAVVRQAGHCVALLPQIGGGGTGGALYRCAWLNLQLSLIRTVHQLLDELLVDMEELQTFLPESSTLMHEPLSLPSLEKTDVVLGTQSLARRLCIVSTFLEEMLVRAFPVPKKIAVDAILAVICRGLGVTPSALTQTTTHTLALAMVLPGIHLSMLRLLDCHIAALRTNLYPNSGLIIKQVLQVLKWTRSDKAAYGTEKPYRVLRHRAYGLLSRWCNIAKCGSRVEDVADQLIEIAISDFKAERDTVVLSGPKNQKQVKRKRGAMEGIVHNNMPNVKDVPVNTLANKDVCVAALQAMRAMLASACSVMKPTAHKTLQEAVVSILLDVNSGSSSPLIPYSAAEPRLELYRLLLGLVLDPHPVWPSPCNIALQLFAAGQNDCDGQVSTQCTMAIACVEKIIHPAFGSMRFQVPVEDVLSASTVQDSNVTHNESAKATWSSCAVGAVHPPKSDELEMEVLCEDENEGEVLTLQNKNSVVASEKSSVGIISNTHPSSTGRRSLETEAKEPMIQSLQKPEAVCWKRMSQSQCVVASPLSESDLKFKHDKGKTYSNKTKLFHKEQHSLDEMIDLAESNSEKNFSEGDVEEVPVEIDLADSDDGNHKSAVSCHSTSGSGNVRLRRNGVSDFGETESGISSSGTVVFIPEKPTKPPADSVVEVPQGPPCSADGVPITGASSDENSELDSSSAKASPRPDGQHEITVQPESDRAECDITNLSPGKWSNSICSSSPPQKREHSSPLKKSDCSPNKIHGTTETSSSPSALKPVLEDIGETEPPAEKDVGEAEPSAKKARVDEPCNGSDDEEDDDSFDESEMLSSFVDMTVDETL